MTVVEAFAAAPRSNVIAFGRAWAGLGVLVGLQLILWGYPWAATAEHFMLPLIPALGAAPSWLFGLASGAFPVVAALAFRWPRPAFAALSLALAYLLLADWFAFHHGWWMAANVFALLAWLGGPRAPGVAEPLRRHGAIACLRVQFCAVYVLAGLTKLNASFLRGEVLHDVLTWPTLDESSWLLRAAAVGMCAAELLLGAGLLVPRLRNPLVGLGLAMHLGALVTCDAGELFHLFFAAGFLLFLDSQRLKGYAAPWTWWPAALIRWTRLGEAGAPPPPRSATATRLAYVALYGGLCTIAALKLVEYGRGALRVTLSG